MEFIKDFGGIIISVITLGYTIYKNRKTEKLRKEVERVQLDVLQASSLYDNVKVMKREYTTTLRNLTLIENDDKADKLKVLNAFLELHSKYTEFFNEINDYCIKVNCGAIKAEEYIRDTVSKNLSDFAHMQVDTYKLLRDIAKKYDFEDIPRPDYNAFKDYDKFLIKYNGENSSFWTSLKTERRNCGFE